MFGISRPGTRTIVGSTLATAVIGLVSATLASPASAAQTHRPPHLAPATPVLSAYYPGGPESNLVPDRTAHLILRDVVARSGRIRSVTLYRSDGRIQPVPVDKSATHYDITVPRLTNGRKYVFVAQVCNTADRCSKSNAITFTPFGLPKPPVVFARLGRDHRLDVAWKALDRNGYPFRISCELRVDNLTTGATVAAGPVDPDHAGQSRTKVEEPGTYQASYRCRAGHTGVSSTSAPVQVPRH